MEGPHLVLFTNDLRVHDNPALAAAQGTTIGLFVFDPLWDSESVLGDKTEGATTSLGFRRMAPRRAQFLLESVAELRNSLAALNIPLVIRRGATAEAVRELTGALEGARVHMMVETAPEETRVREDVDVASGGRLTLHESRNMIHPQDLPFAIEDAPELFTNFRRKIEKEWVVRPELPPPSAQESRPLPVPLGELPTIQELTGEPAPEGPPRFAGGESAALARLEEYFWRSDRLGVYRQTRNGMVDDASSSKLSPYLARGCLSARRVYHEVRRYEAERVANDSTYWLIFEMLWRDFYGIIQRKHGRQFFHSDGILKIRLPIIGHRDPELFRAWAEGKTGITLVDAAQRELLATGYQSNRARQNVASVLIKNLRLDWRLGAAWFERHLLCHDPASNTGNWLYTAGIGNDGRMWRIYNPNLQFERYDPEGEFAQRWLPELAGLTGEAIRNPEPDVRAARGYPMPIVDYATSGAQSKAEYRSAAGFKSSEGKIS